MKLPKALAEKRDELARKLSDDLLLEFYNLAPHSVCKQSVLRSWNACYAEMQESSPDDTLEVMNLKRQVNDGKHAVAAYKKREKKLIQALKDNMDWIGTPPTHRHSFDSQREDAWAKGKAILKELNHE